MIFKEVENKVQLMNVITAAHQRHHRSKSYWRYLHFTSKRTEKGAAPFDKSFT